TSDAVTPRIRSVSSPVSSSLGGDEAMAAVTPSVAAGPWRIARTTQRVKAEPVISLRTLTPARSQGPERFFGAVQPFDCDHSGDRDRHISASAGEPWRRCNSVALDHDIGRASLDTQISPTMQGNGFKIFLTVFFLGLSAYYLYPSVQNYFITQKLNQLEGEERQAYEAENLRKIRSVQERALKLGLDLQGGMHVTLEVRTDELLRELATDTDETFDEVLAAAREAATTTDASIIDAFVEE